MEFIKNLIISLRPKQYIKNLFVFAALLFVKEFNDWNKIVLTLKAFVLFCLISSAIYLFNDILDLAGDREHPAKKMRPIAAGKVSVKTALVTGIILLATSLGLSFYLNYLFGLVILFYFVLNILYSSWLKTVVIVDVLIIAVGFVARVVAGAVVISVVFSPWLIFCTLFLTLFLAISKRKTELLQSSGVNSRQVLSSYSVSFLDQMNTIVLPLTLITYTFYTFSSEHSKLLMLTVPIVLYGMFRYLFIINNQSAITEGPTDELLADRHLQITVLVWLITVFIILYFFK